MLIDPFTYVLRTLVAGTRILRGPSMIHAPTPAEIAAEKRRDP